MSFFDFIHRMVGNYSAKKNANTPQLRTCFYCGFKSASVKNYCRACHEGLVDSFRIELAPETKAKVVPRLIDLHLLDGGLKRTDRIYHPNWEIIHHHVATHIDDEDHNHCWREIAMQWLERLGVDLGNYYFRESPQFFLLCSVWPDQAERLLAMIEDIAKRTKAKLKDTVWSNYSGKHVLLLFSNEDDYYSYVSNYYSEGFHPLNKGVFLSQGYAHIAATHRSLLQDKELFAGLFAYNCVCHLQMPEWLRNGFASAMQNHLLGRAYVPDIALTAQQHGFWRQQDIQNFWAGAYASTDEETLGRTLAEILSYRLADDWPKFLELLKEAKIADAGATAVEKFYGFTLGELVEDFMGEGKWQPNPSAIASLRGNSLFSN